MSVICLENTSAQLHPNVQLNMKAGRAANAQQRQAAAQAWYIREVGYRQRDEIQYRQPKSHGIAINSTETLWGIPNWKTSPEMLWLVAKIF